MWENVNYEDGVARENELRDTPEFWGDMIREGSRLERHTNDRESAVKLLSMFVDASGFVVDLQRQMVDQKKNLSETAAGMELEAELNRERAKFLKQISEVKKEMEDAIKHKDEQSARELRLQNEHWDRKIKEVNEQQAKLESTLQEEHDRRYAEIKAQLQAAIKDADERSKRHMQLLQKEKQARKLQDEAHKKEVQYREETGSTKNKCNNDKSNSGLQKYNNRATIELR